jgi:hypothetical protein
MEGEDNLGLELQLTATFSEISTVDIPKCAMADCFSVLTDSCLDVLNDLFVKMSLSDSNPLRPNNLRTRYPYPYGDI